MKRVLEVSPIFAILLLGSVVSAQNIDISINDKQACITEGVDTILCYQIAEKSFEGTYKRSNYIHPLYTLDRAVLTEDFPDDHLHHRGIFWTWHQLYVGDTRIGDPWEIKDFCWDVESVTEVKSTSDSKTIKAIVKWKSPLWRDQDNVMKPLASEETSITVYPLQSGYRQIDVEISILGLEKNMRLGGSEDPKGYGGFSPRIKLVDDTKFMNGSGPVQPTNLPVAKSPWMDITGSVGQNNSKAGFSVISHPDNPGYPNPWILRSKRSMQNAVYPYPGAEAVTLSDLNPTILRYRLIVHDGSLEADKIERIKESYGKK